MARITAEQIPISEHSLFCSLHDGADACRCNTGKELADSLNDPAIRRLVMEAVIEEAQDDDQCVVLHYADGAQRGIDALQLIRALCPATPNPEEPHG